MGVTIRSINNRKRDYSRLVHLICYAFMIVFAITLCTGMWTGDVDQFLWSLVAFIIVAVIETGYTLVRIYSELNDGDLL